MTEEHRDPSTEEEPEQLSDEELQDLDDEGPDAGELDEEPDYDPDGPLKDLKGG